LAGEKQERKHTRNAGKQNTGFVWHAEILPHEHRTGNRATPHDPEKFVIALLILR
jgi:hypothetical protein